MTPCCLSLSFIRLPVWEEMSFKEFQDEHQKGTIVAILNLQVALMPFIEVQFNQTVGLGEDVV